MRHKYSFNCTWSDEDGAFIASVPELPGCSADGRTVPQALKALDVVIDEWIETANEDKRPVPKPLTAKVSAEFQKKFREKLSEHVQRQVEIAVEKVIQGISNFNPALTGGKDPADYWKIC